jgi:ABC-type polar amino acid transport system ATPase subunit
MEGPNERMTSVLDITGLCLSRGTRRVLRGVTFEVQPREVVALMGLSGSGKTTVLRSVAGLEPFDEGAIRVGDVCLNSTSRPTAADPLRRQVGMVFQFHNLFDHMSAIENVCLAPVHVQHVDPVKARTRGMELLEELGVGARAAALPRELSGGEAQRVAIARALAIDPPLLLLDEPTASLDPARRGELGESLNRLAAAGRSLVVTCHDDDFVREHATRVIILSEGVVVEQGTARDVLTAPQHAATKALLNHE